MAASRTAAPACPSRARAQALLCCSAIPTAWPSLQGSTSLLHSTSLSEGPLLCLSAELCPTCTLQGVPTVWLGLIDHMERQQLRLGCLKMLAVGGAACPRCARSARSPCIPAACTRAAGSQKGGCSAPVMQPAACCSRRVAAVVQAPAGRTSMRPANGPLLTCCAARPCSRIIDFFEGQGVEVRQMWGMTELCPIGSLGGIKVGQSGVHDRRHQGGVACRLDPAGHHRSRLPAAHQQRPCHWGAAHPACVCCALGQKPSDKRPLCGSLRQV